MEGLSSCRYFKSEFSSFLKPGGREVICLKIGLSNVATGAPRIAHWRQFGTLVEGAGS